MRPAACGSSPLRCVARWAIRSRSAAAATSASTPTRSRAIGLQRINRAGRPFTTYLHPWEFDPEQPRIRAGRLRSFRHYVNLRRTESRLVRLMRDFSFGTMSESLAAFAPDFAGQPPTPVLRRAA